MIDTIGNFFEGLINTIVSVPEQFFRQIISNDWEGALRSLISPGGLVIFVIILLAVLTARGRSDY